MTPRNRKLLLRSLGIAAAVAFLGFSVWLIHEANIGRDNILFKTVRATPYGDKIGHALLAGFLALGANFLLRHRVWRPLGLPLPLGSLAVFLLAAAEEASQYYQPYRSLDWADALANLIGIALFSIPAFLIDRKRRKAAHA